MTDRSAALRSFLRQVTPPLLLDVYRRVRHGPTWKGVYPHIAAVPATTDQAQLTHGWPRSTPNPAVYEDLRLDVRQEHDFLALVMAVICRENRGSVTVVDFGGGLGISYVHALKAVRECADLKYHVIELEWACREGSRLFAADPGIRFHHARLDDVTDIDLLNIMGSLQYVEDYAATLRTLCAYQARYILLMDLHAGSFAPYAAAQLNVQGVVLAHWFLNLDEIIGIVRAGGYDLIFQGLVPNAIDQRNFPPDLRLPEGRPSVLLFARIHHES